MCCEFNAKMHLDAQNIKQLWHWASALEVVLITLVHLTTDGHTNSFTHIWYPECWRSRLTCISWLRSKTSVRQSSALTNWPALSTQICPVKLFYTHSIPKTILTIDKKLLQNVNHLVKQNIIVRYTSKNVIQTFKPVKTVVNTHWEW